MGEASTSKSYVRALQSETATNIMMEHNNSKSVQLGTMRGRSPDEEMNNTEGRKSPWLHNNGNFNSNVVILKSDLILPKPLLKLLIIICGWSWMTIHPSS